LGWTYEQWEDHARSTEQGWGDRAWVEEFGRWVAPSVVLDEATIRTFATYLRNAASPGTAAALDRMERDTDVRHVLARHEQGAGHMAEGYARASGRAGVAIATSGPGATNLVTPIADAWMDSTPLVCITGQVRSHLIGTDAFQECDITGITIPVVTHPLHGVERVHRPLEHDRGPGPPDGTEPPGLHRQDVFAVERDRAVDLRRAG
jgi:hypothetical protein